MFPMGGGFAHEMVPHFRPSTPHSLCADQHRSAFIFSFGAFLHGHKKKYLCTGNFAHFITTFVDKTGRWISVARINATMKYKSW